jgi:flagellar hook-basal body complex protein FliE
VEASERPQLPLDDADGATIRPFNDRLVIEHLTVDDPRAAKLVRDRAEAGHPPAQTVRDAVEIGARVLEREGTAAEVDYVRAEFERQAAELRERLAKALESGDELLAARITETFDGSRDGSVQKDIDVLLKQALTEQREALLKQFSAQEGSNPLFDFKDTMVKVYKELGNRQQAEGEENRKVIAELKRELIELKERTDADGRVAEEAERGTAKGRTFEELVHAMIEEIAQAQGDAAHHVGDASTESGGKKGDTVVEIGGAIGNPLATVVFEAKNKKLSKNDAWTELNGCMGERDAAFAVLVVAGEDKIPSGLEELTEYQGNKIIAVLDRDEPDPLALRLVYRYVRARALADGADELEVDAAGVRDAAEEAAARLKRANRVRKSLTNVANSAKAAGDEFDEIVADVERCLTRIETLVASAAKVSVGE